MFLAFRNPKAFIIHVIWLNNYEIIIQNILSNDFSQRHNRKVKNENTMTLPEIT